MNREIIAKLFPQMLERIDNGLCSLCANKVDPNEFKDELSVKEFGISGMCQGCQDEVFKEE